MFLEDDSFFTIAQIMCHLQEPFPMPFFGDDSSIANLAVLDNVSEALYDANAEIPKKTCEVTHVDAMPCECRSC